VNALLDVICQSRSHFWISVGGKNKFVHLALQHTLNLVAEIHSVAHVQERLSNGLDIAAVGDNDFYSQRAQVSSPGVTVRPIV
jgi:phosphomevalonate kinase